jgi:hypothetical protein
MIVPTLQTQKGQIFSFVLDDGFGTRFPSSSFVKFVSQSVTFGMGTSMTAIMVGQTVHPSRLSRIASDAAIKFGRLTNDRGGYSVGSAQVGDEGSNVTARSQQFAGGFVDFLLGRGGRHPR